MATNYLASAILPGAARTAATTPPIHPAAHADSHDYTERYALEQLDAPDTLASHLLPLPPVSVFDSTTVIDTEPWWQPGLLLEPIHLDGTPLPATSAQLCAEFVDEFAHLRPRINTNVAHTYIGMPTPHAAFITPPQHYDAAELPTELLEAAAVALLASSSRGGSQKGPSSAPPALCVAAPTEAAPVAQRHASAASGVMRARHTGRRSTLAHSPSLHASIHHALSSAHQYDDVPTVYCCRWVGCSAVFTAAHELTDHLGTDHIPRRQDVYYCGWTECKRATHCFRHRDKLMVHVRLHTGDRRFHCPEEGCGREFSRADSFEEHRRVHASEGRAQVCQVEGCGRRYYHAKSLRKHQRQVHGMLFSSDVASPAQAQLAASTLEAMAHRHVMHQSLPSAEDVSPIMLSPLHAFLL